MFVDGVGGPMGTSGQTCYLLNTGTLAVAEANYGRLSQAAGHLGKIANQLTVEMPGALPELAASAQYNLRAGPGTLAETASHGGPVYRTVVSGSHGLALTIGAVVPAGSAVASVTLNGHPVSYRATTTNAGLAVTVSVPAPAGSEALIVRLK